MADIAVGESIPQDTPHAVSVSLPTWKANVGYEEGEHWVVSKMTTGYPRFFIHKTIDAFALAISQRYGEPDQKAMLFPTRRAADRCVAFMHRHASSESVLTGLKVIDLILDQSKSEAVPLRSLAPAISAVLIAPEAWPFAKQYWQHSGDGVSSRRAEFCHRLLEEDLLVLHENAAPPSPPSPDRTGKPCRGPRRYQRPTSFDANTNTNGHFKNGTNGYVAINGHGSATSRSPERTRTNGGPTNGTINDHGQDAMESSRFLEERYGRNLDLSFVSRAKSAIKRRIAGTLTTSVDIDTTPLPSQKEASKRARAAASTTTGNATPPAILDEDDIYLFPCGMNAIFNAHRLLLAAAPKPLKSISYGFPYVDTLKILEKFGPGCLFYGRASTSELDDLESRLESGERYLGLFVEFPGNPLLTCPDLSRIRRLADKYHFAVVIDETIGTFENINVVPYADIIVSSLTKIFSGDCNVMGGSAILNPASPMYAQLKKVAEQELEDLYWPEDVIFMERNSRDFASRVDRINSNAEAICKVLLDAEDIVKRVYYPKYNPPPCKENFDIVRLPGGGYGGLLSVTFKEVDRAVAFFDAVATAKGPSLGTNFTLASPYVLLAHYGELEWAQSLGVDKDLVRVSVGLEDEGDMKRVFKEALDVARRVEVGVKGA